MKLKKENRSSWLFLPTIVLVTVLFVVLTAGIVWAHYETSAVKEQGLQYLSADDKVYLLSAEKDAEGNLVTDEKGNLSSLGAWETLLDAEGEPVSDTYTLDFLLANGKNLGKYSTQEQTASVVLFSTIGIENANNIKIVLQDGGSKYTAVPIEVEEGSVWYDTYGPGWLYQFSNKAGETLSWVLPGGIFGYRQMSLTVTGTSEYVSAFHLIAFTQSGWSLAHDRNTGSWDGQLEPAKEEETEITSTLLTEEGQNVWIHTASAAHQIEIPVYKGQDIAWSVSAVSNAPEYLQATVSQDPVLSEETGAQLVYLSVNVLVPMEEETTSAEVPLTGTAAEETTTEETDTVEEDNTEASPSEGENTTDDTESEEDTSAEETPSTDSQNPDSTSGIPDTASVDVTLTYGETETKTLSATFYIPLKKEASDTASYTGKLSVCPTQYDPFVKIPLRNGSEATELYLNQALFPAQTRYTIGDEKANLLYDGGTVKIPADAVAALDLSQTEISDSEIVMHAADAEYKLTYVEVPQMDTDDSPLLMTEDSLLLPISYIWGNAEPDIQIEHLIKNKGELVWEQTDKIQWESAEGNLRLKTDRTDAAKAAEAGTYRITISWNENEMTLYSLETVFFVQCRNAG